MGCISFVVDDLQNNGFAGSLKEQSDTFSVTFIFPVEHREAFDAYIKENKKESLELLIIKQICRDAEAK